ncbi:UNVERIFIED_CONTAM: Gibberellin 2-beta-dioxygenase 4 [Sesamum calycinum]|uniref:Gibberellin 2-beta-dioxygenase 4 n=1 Tax=Sesamum calycinum TaxID=2727403 RepID=A0AAW2R844_9LAMI
MLTLLRSNGVEGLQISLEEGVWVPVNPHPESAFCVNVGDVLKVKHVTPVPGALLNYVVSFKKMGMGMGMGLGFSGRWITAMLKLKTEN